MTGFNLPPGCSVRDLPGNSPADEAAEAVYDKIYEIELRAREAHPELGDAYVEAMAEAFFSMVSEAYGQGYSQARADDEEARQIAEIEAAAAEWRGGR